MRRRKSKNFSEPTNPAPLPRRTLTPRQDERAREAFVVSSLIAMLRHEWRARADEDSATELVEAWAPVMPGPIMRALEAEEEGDDRCASEYPDEHDLGADFSLLLAFTDRMLSLDLPSTEVVIFGGPPILDRRRDGSAVSTAHVACPEA